MGMRGSTFQVIPSSGSYLPPRDLSSACTFSSRSCCLLGGRFDMVNDPHCGLLSRISTNAWQEGTHGYGLS